MEKRQSSMTLFDIQCPLEEYLNKLFLIIKNVSISGHTLILSYSCASNNRFQCPCCKISDKKLKKGQGGSFLNFRFLAPKATVYMFRLQNNAESLKMVYGTLNM